MIPKSREGKEQTRAIQKIRNHCKIPKGKTKKGKKEHISSKNL